MKIFWMVSFKVVGSDTTQYEEFEYSGSNFNSDAARAFEVYKSMSGEQVVATHAYVTSMEGC